MSEIHIDLAQQRLTLTEEGQVVFDTSISTAANGPGERIHSECTPRGWHIIRAKIGAGAAENAVFVGRRANSGV